MENDEDSDRNDDGDDDGSDDDTELEADYTQTLIETREIMIRGKHVSAAMARLRCSAVDNTGYDQRFDTDTTLGALWDAVINFIRANTKQTLTADNKKEDRYWNSIDEYASALCQDALDKWSALVRNALLGTNMELPISSIIISYTTPHCVGCLMTRGVRSSAYLNSLRFTGSITTAKMLGTTGGGEPHKCISSSQVISVLRSKQVLGVEFVGILIEAVEEYYIGALADDCLSSRSDQ